MRYLFLILMLTACTLTPTRKTPKLKKGSCYSLDLYSTYDPSDPTSSSSGHELSQFKVIGIFEWQNHQHYAIQVLTDKWEKNGNHDLVPLYSKSKTYGFARVDEFDKYIAINAHMFSPMWDSAVKCNKLTKEDFNKDEPRVPLMRVGNDLDGMGK